MPSSIHALPTPIPVVVRQWLTATLNLRLPLRLGRNRNKKLGLIRFVVVFSDLNSWYFRYQCGSLPMSKIAVRDCFPNLEAEVASIDRGHFFQVHILYRVTSSMWPDRDFESKYKVAQPRVTNLSGLNRSDGWMLDEFVTPTWTGDLWRAFDFFFLNENLSKTIFFFYLK